MKKNFTKQDFYDILQPNGDCLEWTKALNAYGYGVTQYGNYNAFKAHRLSLILEGYDITGKHVLHKCDNPKCCNPNHLFIGSQNDNMKDMKQKRRSTIGEKNPRSILTEKNVIEIIDLKKAGKSVKDISTKFGVHIQTIYDILQGRKWKHISNP